MIEYAIAAIAGFGLGLCTKIARAPLPEVQRPSDDAFRLDRSPAPPKRWNVIGRLREVVIRYAARQWGKL